MVGFAYWWSNIGKSLSLQHAQQDSFFGMKLPKFLKTMYIISQTPWYFLSVNIPDHCGEEELDLKEASGKGLYSQIFYSNSITTNSIK